MGEADGIGVVGTGEGAQRSAVPGAPPVAHDEPSGLMSVQLISRS